MEEKKPETFEPNSTQPAETQHIDTRGLITITYFITHDGTKMAYALPKRKTLVIAILLIPVIVVGTLAEFISISISPWLSALFVIGIVLLAVLWHDKAGPAGYYEVDEQGNPLKFVTSSYIGREKRMSKERFLRAVQG